MADANIRAVITAKDEASGVLNGFGGSLGGVAVAAGIALAGVAALTAGAVESVKAFEESENIAAQLNNVLRSTGGAAGVTSDAAIALSKNLEHLTGISDETALNAENILLTFTAIKKDAFEPATRAAVDMATALNHGMVPSMEDVQAKAMLIGKALQDPDAGLGALHRVGVNVEELKKKFTEGMPIQEKQRLILQELGTEFGGAGEAAGKTFAGSIAKASENLNDLMEKIGELITRAISPAINWFNKMFESVGGVDGIVNQLKIAWDEIVRVFNQYVLPFLQILWLQIKTQLLPVLQDFWDKNKNWLAPALKDLAIILAGGLVAAIIVVIATLSVVVALLTATIAIVNGVGQAVQWLVKQFVAFGTAIGQAMAQFYVNVQIAYGVNKQFVDGVINGMRSIVNFIFAIGGSILSGLISPFITAANIIGSIINGIKSNIGGIGGGILNPLLAGAGLPHRAGGGAVNAGQAYIVGEQRPEVFVPNTSGSIVPVGSGGAGQTINITVQAGAFMGSQQDARKYAMQILDSLKDVAASKGTTVGGLL